MNTFSGRVHFNTLSTYKPSSGDTYNRVEKCGHIASLYLDLLKVSAIPVNNTEYCVSEPLPTGYWPKDHISVMGYIDSYNDNVLTKVNIDPNDGCVYIKRIKGTDTSGSPGILIEPQITYIC